MSEDCQNSRGQAGSSPRVSGSGSNEKETVAGELELEGWCERITISSPGALCNTTASHPDIMLVLIRLPLVIRDALRADVIHGISLSCCHFDPVAVTHSVNSMLQASRPPSLSLPAAARLTVPH